MDLYDRILNTIKKLQNLPESHKKVIFFIVIAISTLILGYRLIISIENNITIISRSAKSISLPEFKINQPNIDNIDVNNIDFSNIDIDPLDVVSESDSREIIEK